MNAARIRQLASNCGFELSGVARAAEPDGFAHFLDWRARGLAAQMRYLTDHRGDVRAHPRNLLDAAQSVVMVGKLYNTAAPRTFDVDPRTQGWISRYAWGGDYHDTMRDALNALAARMRTEAGPFAWRACVDTAPLLERDFARAAGLGWIGKNTCLINQHKGSWFFLGALLVSLEIDADAPAAQRCGTCRRCVDACPTQALVERDGRWELDARRCIAYLTIEHRGDGPAGLETKTGHHVFGCDICQEVCPWNRRAPVTTDPHYQPRNFAPLLEELEALDEAGFRRRFHRTPLWRTGLEQLKRNVKRALGNR